MEAKIAILIADDEVEIVSTLSKTIELLAKDHGLSLQPIVTASDGTTALVKLRNQKFDVLILDNDMPKKKGVEVLELIKQSNIKVQVIFVSGKLITETVELLSTYRQIVDVIAKPYDIDRIMANIVKCAKKINN